MGQWQNLLAQNFSTTRYEKLFFYLAFIQYFEQHVEILLKNFHFFSLAISGLKLRDFAYAKDGMSYN